MIRFTFLIVILYVSSFVQAQLDTNQILLQFAKADSAWENPSRCLSLTKAVIPKLKKIGKLEKYGYALNTLSYCYNQLGDYNTLIQNNMFVVKEIKDVLGESHIELYKAQNNLAYAYKLHGELNNAKQLYEDAIEGARSFDKNYNLLATSYMNLGNLFKQVEDYDLANQYYISAEPLMKLYGETNIASNSNSFQRLASLYNQLGNINFIFEKSSLAKNYFGKAFDIINRNPKISQQFKNKIRLNIASFYIDSDEMKNAIKTLTLVANSTAKIIPSNESILYKLRAKVALKNGMLDKAFSLLSTSFEINPKNRVNEGINILLLMYEISPEKFKIQYSIKLNEILNKLDKESKLLVDFKINFIELEQGLIHCSNVLSQVKANEVIIQKILSGYASNTSKHTFLKKANTIIKINIGKAYKASTICSDTLIQKRIIYHLIENSKSIVFNMEKLILEYEAEDNAIKEIRKKILLLEENKSKNKDSLFFNSKILKFKEIHNDLYDKAISNISRNRIPNYEQIQIKLLESESIYSTFLSTDSCIYICRISGDSFKVEKKNLSKKESGELLEKLSLGKINIDNFIKSYQNELLPSNNGERHILSLDSWLNYWPFSLGITAAKKYNVRRVFSSKELMINETSECLSTINYFNPKYVNNPLTEDEFLFSMNLKVEKKENWYSNVNQCDILHFSGHSTSLDKISKSPMIYTGEKNIAISELYNQRLVNNMFVLSSCEGHLGEEILGEGVNNLNRSLAIIGSKSIVASLWNVNAQTTSKILEYFYTNLNKNQNKSEALANAKQSFISECPDYQKHPYYWSGIVLSGNNMPLNIATKNINPFTLYDGIILVVVLIIIIFLYRKSILSSINKTTL